jgi:hypothetical protein
MRNILNTLVEALSLLWRALDQARRLAVNLLFILLVFVLLSWLLVSDKPEVPASTALVLDPVGGMVEQLYGTPDERALLKLMGRHRPESLVRSVREAIREAGGDDRVKALYLDLNRLGGAGLATLQTLRRDIEEFKATGKPVVAAADVYSQSRYFLAASADAWSGCLASAATTITTRTPWTDSKWIGTSFGSASTKRLSSPSRGARCPPRLGRTGESGSRSSGGCIGQSLLRQEIFRRRLSRPTPETSTASWPTMQAKLLPLPRLKGWSIASSTETRCGIG